VKLLEEEGVEFQKVDYFKKPFSKSSLKALLKKAGLKPRDVLRKRAPQYKALGLADETLSEATLVAALVDHPDLLERPIVERGDQALLGRPIEKVRELL
jgi:arsenate reductase